MQWPEDVNEGLGRRQGVACNSQRSEESSNQARSCRDSNRGSSTLSDISIQVENLTDVTRSPVWVQLSLFYDRQSVDKFVLVSGSPLGPMTRFYPHIFFSGNCLVVLPLGRPLWREDGSVTYSAIADWSGHWGHYRLIWDCVPSSSPLTIRRDYGGGILTSLHLTKPEFIKEPNPGPSYLVNWTHAHRGRKPTSGPTCDSSPFKNPTMLLWTVVEGCITCNM
jgi:hypothetical protein